MSAPAREQSSARSMARRRLVVVASVAAAVDLGSKVAASAFLPDRLVGVPGPLDLYLSHNPGVAFGLGDAVPAWLLLALTATVAVFLAAAGWSGAFSSPAGAGLVLGGAVANLADRLQAGTVVDMLHLGWWPTFNLADVWITLGAAFLMLGETRATGHGAAEPQGGVDHREVT
jgi:signal peptidase II